jgi:peptidoglycan/LPS O-acetylase OafA/YrhL
VYSLALRDTKPNLLPAFGIVILWLAIAFLGKMVFHWTTRPFFWCEVFLLAVLVDVSVRWNWQARFLAFFGRLSYSMYLFHFAVLYFLEKAFGNHWPYWIGLPIVLLVTSLLAMGSRVTAEKWSQDAGRALIRSWWSAPHAARLAPRQPS